MGKDIWYEQKPRDRKKRDELVIGVGGEMRLRCLYICISEPCGNTVWGALVWFKRRCVRGNKHAIYIHSSLLYLPYHPEKYSLENSYSFFKVQFKADEFSLAFKVSIISPFHLISSCSFYFL